MPVHSKCDNLHPQTPKSCLFPPPTIGNDKSALLGCDSLKKLFRIRVKRDTVFSSHSGGEGGGRRVPGQAAGISGEGRTWELGMGAAGRTGPGEGSAAEGATWRLSHQLERVTILGITLAVYRSL